VTIEALARLLGLRRAGRPQAGQRLEAEVVKDLDLPAQLDDQHQQHRPAGHYCSECDLRAIVGAVRAKRSRAHPRQTSSHPAGGLYEDLSPDPQNAETAHLVDDRFHLPPTRRAAIALATKE
jgi:hypothetical protein